MEFHISRSARDRYSFDLGLYSLNGNVVFANFMAVRIFAQKMNEQRDLVNFPDQAVRAGQLNAMGMIDEINHLIFRAYRQQRNPGVLREALSWFNEQVGQAQVELALRAFCEEFPPLRVYRNEQRLEEYLEAETDGIPNRQIALEEMIVLWLANINPAFAPFQELFDDSNLRRETTYTQMTRQLREFFTQQPSFGKGEQNLIDMLRAPALARPDSLFAQLEFMQENWGTEIGGFWLQVMAGMDLIREEEKPIFVGGGPGPAVVYEFQEQEFEPEAFSPDLDWMPRLVLIAKNSFVWLDQLSKKYQRPIQRLDEIPEAELEQLARWGITGLWLIGVWERSQASQKIKQLRGNPEAVASAYSLYDYQVSQDLGGPEGFQKLRERAWRYGIRMASDMVPNHMGVDSRWVIHHPGWFIGQDYSPFPTYQFNGPDLSQDERVGIFIEDHYYDSSDAAVVFKRLDRYTGSVKYIYHGNDGTSMPWNDTAQLNYLLPEVREAVIQTILHVARQFPIIRFDAAMTLAKKHYQRLWFPEPGKGGDIPSRAEHAMTKDAFDAAFPVEFWREVVDRVAQEVPDTLLLAEAFWLMEGYFVRSLGMHRVYNSAFMNMLRDEKNLEFRLTIKNTLEFDPEIMKRYVNFMNNPDEKTAVEQFGKGDKYFGICILMATLPGLPMFGHGQVEGFTEKYGMEYRRAYWDEQIDSNLVTRHEREVFPLLRRRRLFADVENFLLYDLYDVNGAVNEDVIAYSNRIGEERSLILYHNRFQTARGWIKTSAAYSAKMRGGERELVQRHLAEGLGLDYDGQAFTIFRDAISGLEILRNNREIHERGLYVELEAYQTRVYLNIRQVRENEEGDYASLAAYLQGGGVPSIAEAILERKLETMLSALRRLVNGESLKPLVEQRMKPITAEAANLQAVLEETEAKVLSWLKEVKGEVRTEEDEVPVAYEILQRLTATLYLPALAQIYPSFAGQAKEPIRQYLENGPMPAGESEKGWLESGKIDIWAPLLVWIFLHLVGKLKPGDGYESSSRKWLDEMLFGKVAAEAFRELSIQHENRFVNLVKILTAHQSRMMEVDPRTEKLEAARQVLREWFIDLDVQRWTGVNRYEGVSYFNQESFEALVWWMFTTAAINILAEEPEEDEAENQETRKILRLESCFEIVRAILQLERESGYRVDQLVG